MLTFFITLLVCAALLYQAVSTVIYLGQAREEDDVFWFWDNRFLGRSLFRLFFFFGPVVWVIFGGISFFIYFHKKLGPKEME